MSERRAKRIYLYVPLGAGALIFAAYALAWRAGAGTLRSSIDAWAAAQQTSGLDVRHGAINIHGFPFFLRATIDGVSVATKDARWTTSLAHVDVHPLDPRRMILSAPRTQELRTRATTLNIESPKGRVSIARDTKRGWIADLQSGATRISGREFQATADEILLTAAPVSLGATALETSVAADGMVFARDDGASDPATVKAMLVLSADSIGIRRLEAALPQARAVLSGEIALSAPLHATIDAEIANPGAFARFLGAAGLITTDQADDAASQLTLAAIPSGGKLKGPIEVSGQQAKFAGIKIATIGGQP